MPGIFWHCTYSRGDGGRSGRFLPAHTACQIGGQSVYKYLLKCTPAVQLFFCLKHTLAAEMATRSCAFWTSGLWKVHVFHEDCSSALQLHMRIIWCRSTRMTLAVPNFPRNMSNSSVEWLSILNVNESPVLVWARIFRYEI